MEEEEEEGDGGMNGVGLLTGDEGVLSGVPELPACGVDGGCEGRGRDGREEEIVLMGCWIKERAFSRSRASSRRTPWYIVWGRVSRCNGRR